MAGIAPQASETKRDDVVQDDEGNVTPEEQESYDNLVTTGMELLYSGGEVRPAILEMLDEDPEDLKAVLGDLTDAWDQPDPDNQEGLTLWETQQPIIALAATACILVLEAVEQSGTTDLDVIKSGGEELIGELASLSADAGLYDYDDNEVSAAFLKAVDLYREAAASAGLVDKQALAAQFDEIVKADKEGRLNEVVPGLEQPEEEEPDVDAG